MTLHDVPYSTGLALCHVPDDGEPGSNEFSFRVKPDGEVVELGGMGMAGALPQFPHPVNAPSNPLRVHTVAVEDDGRKTREGVRELIDQHTEKYGECQVHVGVGVGRDLVNWCRMGCPDDFAVLDDDAIREANDAGLGRAEVGNFTESNPRPGGEKNSADIPEPLEVQKRVVADARERAVDQAPPPAEPKPEPEPEPEKPKAEKVEKAVAKRSG